MSVTHSTPYPRSTGAPNVFSLLVPDELPDRYWYNPRSRSVVISKFAPCLDADLVLANIIPGQLPLDLSSVKRIYEEQQEDACNQERQKASCDTKEKREKKQTEYNNQKPSQTLSKRYPNVEFRLNNDPNQFLVAGKPSQLSRLPFFLPVATPKCFKFTTVIATNMPKQGLLHLLIRHGHQLASNGLSKDILNILPREMRNIVDFLRRDNSDEKNTEFLNAMIKMKDEDFLELLKLQHEAWKLIQRFTEYLGERVTVNGKQQVYFGVNLQFVMVTAPSKELYLPIDAKAVKDKRPVRVIITVFLNTKTDFEKEKGNITKSQKK